MYENRSALLSKIRNAKKIANAIAKQSGVPAKSVREPLQGAVGILFLGTGLYEGYKKEKNL